MKRLVLFAVMLLSTNCLADDRPAILLPREASPNLILAAKEIRRYVYIRTGILAKISYADTGVPVRGNLIAVAPVRSSLLRLLPLDASFRDSLTHMRNEEHTLRTIRDGSRLILLVTGFDDIATLYGAYTFAEKLGVRFQADGDVIPDGKIGLQIPDISEWHSPLFATRGLQPFHDFPEGPDWWNLDDYKSIFSQMAKMKMNFFGLHTYPQGGAGPEPTVWIGFKEDIRPGNGVASSYPARYYTTMGDPSWGYNPKKTDDYFWGCGQLFETDSYGSEIMNGFTPHPLIGTNQPIPQGELWNVESRAIPETAWNDLFSRSAAFYSSAFDVGRSLGIKICVGTETPLIIPTGVKKRVTALGKDTTAARLRQQLYEGMFERIKQTYPIDYYWFWTPEDWTWSGNNELQVKQTRGDLEAAQQAAQKVPFSLATCGWVLGPKQDRSTFDTFLPRSWAISCINRDLGYEPVDAGFAKITNRPKWAIPWLEDDPALSIPQLWAGRVRRDAADALAYGCTGLIGIHWRTRIISPNISALARAGWQQQGWNPHFPETLTADQAVARSKEPERCLPTEDFYLDWAEAAFGRNVAKPIAAHFSRLDGMKKYDKGRASAMNMPVPADWVGGPGGIKVDSLTWESRKSDYTFVDDFQKIRDAVTGPENLERFDYWLNTFKYLRATGRFACSAGEINRLIDNTKKDTLSDRSMYRQPFVDLRTRQMQELEEVFLCLLRTVNTKGELGTVANWQQHIMTFFVFAPGHEIEKLLHQPLPETCWPSQKSLDQQRIIVPTVRTSARKGEDLRVKAILPSGVIHSARLFWKHLDAKQFKSGDLRHVNRAVWEGTIRAGEFTDDLEYYLEVKTSHGLVRYPAGAPRRNQTVVVY